VGGIAVPRTQPDFTIIPSVEQLQQMKTNCGVAILASDGIYEWLLPFLESYRRHNPDLPTYLIPFDARMERTTRAAAAYDVQIAPGDLGPVDQLGFTAYPLYRRRYRNRLRKFHALSLPLDEVLYVDIDTIVYHDLSVLFGRLKPGETDFIAATTSPDWVYNKRMHRYPFLSDAVLFSDGCFVTAPRILSLERMIATLKANRLTFWNIRKQHVYAQPVANFVAHRLGLKVALADDLIPGNRCEAFYKTQGVRFEPGGPVSADGKPIHVAHWAGASETPTDDVFAASWHECASKAAERLRR
jgi:hypothetical protein